MARTWDVPLDCVSRWDIEAWGPPAARGPMPLQLDLFDDSKAPSVPVGTDPLARQVGGDHYRELKVQPAVFLRQLGVPHLEGEAIYRILRHKRKAGREDLEKAIHALQIIIKLDYEGEGK